ncbi:glycoside hydrolase superfamily [Obelidium mucronatum]|nr:glycoside hydrolase superfamily [Obelidium mucronatum]
MPAPPLDASSKSRRKKYIIIGIVVLVVLGVGGGLAGYFVSKNNKKGSSSSSGSSSSGGTVTKPINEIDYHLPMIRNQLIGYYGQNAVANGVNILNGTNSRVTAVSDYQDTLAHYCSTGYYNTINLAFMNIFGGGDNHFTITFSSFNLQNYGGKYVYSGNGMETNPQYIVQNYIKVGMDIQTCQSLGVKVVVSLGGDKTSAYSFSPGDGKRYANLFYNMFLEGKEAGAEKNDNPTVWNPEMIDFILTLRTLSPKTILANENLGDVITATSNMVDYLIVTQETGRLLFPAGFLNRGQLQAVYDMVKDDPQFGGFSIYDVSSSNPPALAYNETNYLNPPVSTYSKTVRDVLNGVRVGNGFPPQGPQQNNLLMPSRCGGTWVYANSNCSLKACDPAAPVTGCLPSQHCFSFLQTTCPIVTLVNTTRVP